MYSLRNFLSRSKILTNVLELNASVNSRSIFISRPFQQFIYKPKGDNSENEIHEPGLDSDEDDQLIRIYSPKQRKEWFKSMKDQFELWKQDLKNNLEDNYDRFFMPDQIHKIYTFSEEGTIERWATLCDADEGIGNSSCSLTRSPDGHALFSGNLSTELPKDGKTVRSGFCAVNGPRAVKSFHRKTFYNWGIFSHVVFKIRGDGRQYLINISTEGYWEQNWFNTYSYPLFTRGGPYWQLIKIPFSKFIFSSRGYVQDTQVPIPLEDVRWIGIALSDDIDGPFKLEIDYIGLEIDTSHEEEHAYETYNFDGYFYKN